MKFPFLTAQLYICSQLLDYLNHNSKKIIKSAFLTNLARFPTCDCQEKPLESLKFTNEETFFEDEKIIPFLPPINLFMCETHLIKSHINSTCFCGF